jgi:hypothetical protein
MEVAKMSDPLVLGAAGAELASFLQKLLPGTAAEIDALGINFFRKRRIERAADLLMRAKAECERCGIKPESVSEKFFMPWIENASNEDDESLQAKWVSLLVNAADPEHKVEVRPDFAQILSELAPKDAQILDWLYHAVINLAQKQADDWNKTGTTAKEIVKVFPKISREDVALAIDNNRRLGLFSNLPGSPFQDLVRGNLLLSGAGSECVCLTSYGVAFVRACQGPTEKTGPR